MSDLDKDIEIVKEVQAIFEHLKIHGWVKDITKEVDIDKVIQAIEKVLWALNGKDCVIETQSHNEEVLEKYIAKLEKELKTYKKMAERLAEEVEYLHTVIVDFLGSWQEDYVLENDVNTTKEAVLDCARKEVEKDVKD